MFFLDSHFAPSSTSANQKKNMLSCAVVVMYFWHKKSGNKIETTNMQ